MNKKEYVLFIDSGIGGLSILDHLLTKKSNINIIYYADVKNFPYGGKDELVIGHFLLNIYNELKKKFDIKLIVIACNTASVSALQFLRDNVDIQVVGTVPAVKLAAKVTNNDKIGVIATETTVKLDYLSNLVNDFASDKKVYIQSAPGLALASENFYDDNKLDQILNDELSLFKEMGIDTIVLGCTHYSFLDNKIKDFFNNKVQIVDSREGVANRVIYLLPDSIYCDYPDKRLFVSDGSAKHYYEEFNKKLKIFDIIESSG